MREPPKSAAAVAGVLLALGVAALVAVYAVVSGAEPTAVGTGDIGTLDVYGQTKQGPAKLPKDRRVTLPRPQDFAFQFTGEGTGPRIIRIEVEALGEVSVAYEEIHQAPKFKDSLGYTMHLSEDAPDEITIVVTLEAPHAMSRVSRHPVRLVGAESPFWE